MRVALLAVLVMGASGCSAFPQLQPGKKGASAKAQQSHDMQYKVMRFADEYAGGARERSVRLPGGSLLMGSDSHYPEEAPTHRVTVSPF